MVHKLFDEFMAPEIEPTKAYSSRSDVVTFKLAIPNSIVLEIYNKSGGTFGFRYQAWVAWRDAGESVRIHSWWEFEPAPLLTDRLEEAETIAEAHASSIGISLCQEWLNPANQRCIQADTRFYPLP
jgi:hypothetical protein